MDRLFMVLDLRDSREALRPSATGGERVADERVGGVFVDLYDEEYRAFRVLVGDRRGEKWAANLEPSDGGDTFSGGRVEGSRLSDGDPSALEATVKSSLPIDPEGVLVDFLGRAEDEASRSVFLLPRKGSIERLDFCFSSDGASGRAPVLGSWRELCELRKISERSAVFVRERSGVGMPVMTSY